jgi:hypothetical protein
LRSRRTAVRYSEFSLKERELRIPLHLRILALGLSSTGMLSAQRKFCNRPSNYGQAMRTLTHNWGTRFAAWGVTSMRNRT